MWFQGERCLPSQVPKAMSHPEHQAQILTLSKCSIHVHQPSALPPAGSTDSWRHSCPLKRNSGTLHTTLGSLDFLGLAQHHGLLEASRFPGLAVACNTTNSEEKIRNNPKHSSATNPIFLCTTFVSLSLPLRPQCLLEVEHTNVKCTWLEEVLPSEHVYSSHPDRLLDPQIPPSVVTIALPCVCTPEIHFAFELLMMKSYSTYSFVSCFFYSTSYFES